MNKKHTSLHLLPEGYVEFLRDLKRKIKESQKEVKGGLSTTINYTWCGGPWFCDDSILWHICTGHACPDEEPVPGDETPEQP